MTYLDIIALQTVPSSNINRDETGSPKTATFGGVTRSRVSSQSWKRAIRNDFRKSNVELAFRTKLAPAKLAEVLQSKDDSLDLESAMKLAIDTFKNAKISVDKNGELGALLFVGKDQLEKLADYILENKEPNYGEIRKALQYDNPIDLALFGRMVASDPTLNVDASVQLSHAISTHEVIPEYDFYTALDDLKPKEKGGAAMVGTTEFNSATLYRYANVCVDELKYNLGANGGAVEGVAQFIKSFALSMPTGYQNAFGNKTTPEYLLVVVRNDTPVNLVSAFEEPVDSTRGYSEKSVKQLEKEFKNAQKFVEEPQKVFVLSKYDSEIGEQVENIQELMNGVKAELEK